MNKNILVKPACQAVNKTNLRKGYKKRTITVNSSNLTLDFIKKVSDSWSKRDIAFTNYTLEQIAVNGGQFTQSRESHRTFYNLKSVKTISRTNLKIERSGVLSIQQTIKRPNIYSYGPALQNPDIYFYLLKILPSLKYFRPFMGMLLISLGASFEEEVPHNLNELSFLTEQDFLNKKNNQRGEFTRYQSEQVQYRHDIGQKNLLGHDNKPKNQEEFEEMIAMKHVNIDWNASYNPETYVIKPELITVQNPRLSICCEWRSWKVGKKLAYLRSKLIAHMMMDRGPVPVSKKKEAELTCGPHCSTVARLIQT
jgi:hypothetical protein